MDEEFIFRPAEEAEEENTSHNRKKETIKAGKGGDTTKKGGKAEKKTWSDVVKGVEIEDELETTNSGENKSELEMFDSDITNRLRAKQRKGQQKWHQHQNNKEDEKGHISRQADQRVEACRIERVE